MSNGEMVLLLLFCALLALIPAVLLGAVVYVALFVLERLGVIKPEIPKKLEPKRTEKFRGWSAPPGWERAGYDLRRDVQ